MANRFKDDLTCITAIRAGDKLAFKGIFNRYYSVLCNYVTSLTQDSDEAEDIVQNVFITYWNNREHLIITTSLKSYLYKSCYHKYLDLYRKRKRISETLEDYRYQKILSLEEHDLNHELKKIKIIEEAVQKLPPRCREIFVLSKFDGLKYQEIADHLNISKKTVENQIGKAYSFLREAVENSLISVTLLLATILFFAF